MHVLLLEWPQRVTGKSKFRKANELPTKSWHVYMSAYNKGVYSAWNISLSNFSVSDLY